MKSRIEYAQVAPGAIEAMRVVEKYVHTCGIDPKLLELIKIRASQINGCAHCLGITPVRSILLRAAHDKLAHRIFVFYSNRRPEDAAFLEELTALEKENSNYTLIATMTGLAKSARPWNGETEQISQTLLTKYLTGVKSPIYYVVGPPGMVKGVHEMLNSPLKNSVSLYI